MYIGEETSTDFSFRLIKSDHTGTGESMQVATTSAGPSLIAGNQMGDCLAEAGWEPQSPQVLRQKWKRSTLVPSATGFVAIQNGCGYSASGTTIRQESSQRSGESGQQ